MNGSFGLQVVDLPPRETFFMVHKPTDAQHSADLLIHIAAHITETKSHTFKVLCVGITKFTSRKWSPKLIREIWIKERQQRAM